MSTDIWAEELLQHLKRDLNGSASGRHRVSIEDHVFITTKPEGDYVAVEVGDLDSVSSDFQPFVFNPKTTSISAAARDLMPLIRCILWLGP